MTSTTLPLQPIPYPEDEVQEEHRQHKPKAAAPAVADPSGTESRTTETTPHGKEPVQWETVAETMGLLPAQIIAGRLQSEGIPARAWQESLGVFTGMTVGRMGTGHVSVPQEYAGQALEILAEDADDGFLEEAE